MTYVPQIKLHACLLRADRPRIYYSFHSDYLKTATNNALTTTARSYNVLCTAAVPYAAYQPSPPPAPPAAEIQLWWILVGVLLGAAGLTLLAFLVWHVLRRHNVAIVKAHTGTGLGSPTAVNTVLVAPKYDI